MQANASELLENLAEIFSPLLMCGDHEQLLNTKIIFDKKLWSLRLSEFVGNVDNFFLQLVVVNVA